MFIVKIQLITIKKLKNKKRKTDREVCLWFGVKTTNRKLWSRFFSSWGQQQAVVS